MSEATGMEAKTIHRLLEFNPQGQPKALAYAVRNLTVSNRNTKLKERLRGEIEAATNSSPLHFSKPYVLPEENQPMMAAEPGIKRKE